MPRPAAVRRSLSGALLALLLAAPAVHAHEARPAYLELTERAPGRLRVLWRVPVLAGRPLPVALRLPDGIGDVEAPTVQRLADSRLERRLVDTGTGTLAGARIEFPGLELTITDVIVRVVLQDGRRWTTIVRPSQPWLEIAAAPDRLQVAADYLGHGIAHIAFGADHLLFVLGLLLIVRDRWTLVKTVTAFTVAHSLTLALATLGWAALPAEPLNAAIALSIFFLGPEIVRSWRGGTSLTLERPWLVAFLFGLLHGFGFASALTGAGLPPADLALALLAFNLGVELGQLAFVLLVLGLTRAFRELEIRWPSWVAALPAYAVGTLGAYWTLQRTAILFG